MVSVTHTQHKDLFITCWQRVFHTHGTKRFGACKRCFKICNCIRTKSPLYIDHTLRTLTVYIKGYWSQWVIDEPWLLYFFLSTDVFKVMIRIFLKKVTLTKLGVGIQATENIVFKCDKTLCDIVLPKIPSKCTEKITRLSNQCNKPFRLSISVFFHP